MMKMFKKKDGDKKPKAAAKPAVKAKVVVKVKPATAPSPKKAYTPTPAQKKKSAEAGRAAAEKSRASGKKNGPIFNEMDRTLQGLQNITAPKGTKRSKSGGVLDLAEPGDRGRYNGMSNKQLGY